MVTLRKMTGAQPALRYVVRWRHIAAGDEDEKFVLAFLHAAPELEACLRIGLNRQKAAEAALEIAPVNQKRAIRQALAPPSNGNGALQQVVEAWRRRACPQPRCVTAVAKEMGEADLMRCCVVICAPRRSLTQTPASRLRNSLTTALPRLAAMRCATAVAEPNTHCQQVWPSTRAEVSSEAIRLPHAPRHRCVPLPRRTVRACG